MPDRYDPKLSVRPTSDRKSADAAKGHGAQDEDPLVELARIVSGRSTGGAAASQPRGRTVPAGATARPAESPDVMGDLEAELLSDLQASFSAVRGTAAQTPSAAPRALAQPPRVPAPPAAAEAPPARADAPAINPPAQAEQPPARPPRAEAPERQALRPETAAPPPKPSESVAPEPRADGSPPAQSTGSEPAKPRPTVVERAQPRAAAPQPKTVAPRPPSERSPQPTRAAVASDGVDIPNMQLRTTKAATPPAAETPSRQPHPRWDKPAEAEKSPSSVASRFAPPKTMAPVPAQPAADDDEEALGEGFPFAEALADDTAEAETPFDEFDLGPGYGEDDHLPPYPDDELESLIQRRPRRGRIAAIAIIAVVLVGGGSFLLLRGSGTGDSAPPPIITADGSPTKIVPAEEGAAPDSDQNKLIYDRVASGDVQPETTLITPGEEPIAAVPPADAGTDNPISRVIIPGGPGIDQPEAGTAPTEAGDNIGAMIDQGGVAPAADESEPIQPIGPRRVRTVVVRPDGTIVSNEASEAGTDEAPPGTDVAAAEPQPVEPSQPPPATDNDTMAIAGAGTGSDGELAITPVPSLPAESDVAAPAAVATEPARPPASGVAVSDQGPIDITPARPTPRPPTPAPTKTAAAVTNGVLVQVSSQRSEDAARATFRDLQSRYPSILGSYDVDIQRADLGDRGVYFRARVGPFPPGDAERLCSDLKAAGGDCILARR